MKKLCSLFLSLLIVCLCAVGVCADEAQLSAYVTISDENGDLVMVYERIGFYDYDNDGKITINDALASAHIEKYADGIDGYASENSAYGLSLTKLWGAQTGAYGYYVNNASPASLLDEIKDGDHIQAFVYTDTATFSDTFCFFDTVETECAVDDTVTLTLSALTYDENWNTVTVPVANAEILVNGEPVGARTDENGEASFVMKAGGKVTVSARSEDMNLVPPVCRIHSDAGSILVLMVIMMIAIVAVATVTFFTIKKHIATRTLK
jgi:hypothetical protein